MTDSHSAKQSSPSCGWLTLDQVLITSQLNARPHRPPDLEGERRAMQILAETSFDNAKQILDTLVNVAMQICRADSAGISVLEETPGQERFIWPAIAGRFAGNVGNGMSRWASPCGTVLDKNRPLLFEHPEYHFPYAVLVDPPIVEALLAPFHLDGKPVGTVWLVAHSSNRKFDSEDLRLLTKLTEFASEKVNLIRECVAH